MDLVVFIRKATPYDYEAIYTTHLLAVQYMCNQCYNNEILAVWSQLLTPDSYLKSLHNKEFWLIEYKNKIQGFFQLDLKNANLDALYIQPSVHNHGLGTALIHRAETIAYEANMAFIKLYASLNSIYFYKLLNYKTLCSYRVILDEKTGMGADCVLMKKNLSKYNYD